MPPKAAQVIDLTRGDDDRSGLAGSTSSESSPFKADIAAGLKPASSTGWLSKPPPKSPPKRRKPMKFLMKINRAGKAPIFFVDTLSSKKHLKGADVEAVGLAR